MHSQGRHFGDRLVQPISVVHDQPFFTTREEGTGLGLAIAKRYVEQNGGRLEIRSTPGAGTTVRVRLPTGAAA